MPKHIIKYPSDFENIATKIISESKLPPKQQKMLLKLILKSFQIGFSLGMNKITEVDL